MIAVAPWRTELGLETSPSELVDDAEEIKRRIAPLRDAYDRATMALNYAELHHGTTVLLDAADVRALAKIAHEKILENHRPNQGDEPKMNDTIATNHDNDEDGPSLGESLGILLGKVLAELEKLGTKNDAARVGELRSELSDAIENAGASAIVRVAACAAELARELEAAPEVLQLVEEIIGAELGERADAQAETARLEGGEG